MLISIITINKDNKNGLVKTMESVFNQKSSDSLEYIVVDGASTDGSKELIEDNTDRISNWISEPDSGIYNAMNKGARMATGKFLLFLNSGDWLADDEVIEHVTRYIDKNSIQNNMNLVMGSVRVVHNDFKGGELKSYDTAIDSAWDFLCTGIPHQAAFIPRNLLLQNPYDETYKICADFKFFFEEIIIHRISVQHIDLCIANYDLTGISSTNLNLSEEERRRAFLEVLPSAFRNDYAKILPLKDIRFRIKWILSKKWLCQILKLVSSIGMRLS